MSGEVLLLRHGMTAGNLARRYIGVTDEPLCPQGRAALADRRFPPADKVYISPMRRCWETAEILFPGAALIPVPELREMDFGVFEGKTYEELKDTPDYQAWLDSGGEAPIPGGESRADFCARCRAGFARILAADPSERLVFVVHGGTIMAVMEAFARPARPYYDWQVKNGHGFRCRRTETGLELAEPL